ncbi:hypothetical protein SRABI106_01407 [Rahnella aquatilis]|nr:hypothetical protein SRABI106_01407 [Rahnella aquatilis]
MSPAIALWNIVGEAVNVFLETIIPLQRNLNTNIVLHRREIEYGRMDWGFVFVQVFHEGFDTAFIMEVIILTITFIQQTDCHAGVQE